MKTTEDGHYIDDPMDVVNAKPNFDELGIPPWDRDMKSREFYDKLHRLIEAYANSKYYSDCTWSWRTWPNGKGEQFDMSFELYKVED